MEKLLRRLFLSIGKSRRMARFMRRYGIAFGGGRFVAGETLSEAISAAERLNREGMVVTLDHLGEFSGTEGDAMQARDSCIAALEAMDAAGLQCNLSLKPTSLGLDIEEGLCERNLRSVIERAAELNLFVRMDMEDYAHCQKIIDLYQKMRLDYPNVGLAIQACLYRSIGDVLALGGPGINLRLVKGAYKESEQVAFPRKVDVDAAFMALIAAHLSGGGYAAIATHDEVIIDYVLRQHAKGLIAKASFEFQMLYGIREDLQSKLARDGYKVRIYVPYGRDWFGYMMRRLGERPANVWFVMKNWKRKKGGFDER